MREEDNEKHALSREGPIIVAVRLRRRRCAAVPLAFARLRIFSGDDWSGTSLPCVGRDAAG